MIVAHRWNADADQDGRGLGIIRLELGNTYQGTKVPVHTGTYPRMSMRIVPFRAMSCDEMLESRGS